jgi:hypothetical protein
LRHKKDLPGKHIQDLAHLHRSATSTRSWPDRTRTANLARAPTSCPA